MYPITQPLDTCFDTAAAHTQGRTLTADSRRIRPGDVFVACQGEYSDGRSYIADAVARGAAFVFWDSGDGFQWQPEWVVPNLGVADLKQRAGLLAAEVYGNTGHGLRCWGVTGTNGKTSISQWLAQAADLLDTPCAVVGTVGNGFWGRLKESTHTTPDPVQLQTLLHDFIGQGARAVALEVSSHGLDQNRAVGVPFSAAIFTNLTRDHLDYHGDMAAYGASKAKLFQWHSLRHAVINTDDVFGAELAAELRQQRPQLKVYGYGFNPAADIRITAFQAAASGMVLGLRTPWGEAEIKSGLLGRFNAQNLAACVGLLCAEGYALADVCRVLARIRPATGRMDCISAEGKPLVVVDYAHTPDALEKALATLQEIKAPGARLWCVFGCGGNRDRGKRPLMGAAAQAGADCVVVTSDNPRMEAPQSIIDDILPAVPHPAYVHSDRRNAIAHAVQQAGADDIILIAGKGHETYQDVQGVKQHFSDFEEAQQALDAR
ncbi:UDP-N-acetylmuramoyl-L-alanyl-D-glutamate--2,6-diaminopimelate ligase [Neisseria sp. HSC-16F19]|nr:UDP-N-acetylmuramoyl-L-alanyl-D-glutamate--2,6-diaminopimelate ligase [Neisseria sp. HSC-16F19]MCP2041940.1 UDP-N-acetylmuramoyl-L-alanyl-D-glutamate--2,6-diaminopimelate ligase [Neisseria sp. HSC-16F19]